MNQVQWEYRTLRYEVSGFVTPKFDSLKYDDELNQLGRAGWELVSVMDMNAGNGASFALVAVFKRALAR